MKIVESRFLRGPNVHSPYPCFQVILDLGDLDEVASSDIPGFTERLLAWLPSLEGHRCALGYPGGFVERLREGTYMAHITEHVLIELQGLAGADVSFGQARQLPGQPRHYRVVCAYEVERVVEAALPIARDLVMAAAQAQPYELAPALERLRALHETHGLGPSARAVVEAARRRGIPMRRVSEDSSLVQLGYGCRQRRISASLTSRTSAIAVDLAGDKDHTKRLLDEIGLPVPQGRIVHTVETAREVFRALGGLVAVKPLDANHGRGATPCVRDEAELERAVARALEHGNAVIVEEHVEGADYRVLVINGRMVAAARRWAPCVVGDGRRSVEELIAAANEDPRRGEGHCKPMTRIPVDDHTLEMLSRQGMALHSVPAAGQEVMLRDNANLSTGAVAEDVTELVHPEVEEACVRAALCIGLDVAGVDLVCRDIGQPLEGQHGAIIEVNAAPGLRMHEAPGLGQRRPVGRAIVDALFPDPEDDGRIPIIAITGTNGKTTTTLAVSHVLRTAGYRVGTTTTEGVYVDGRRVRSGDCAGYWSARAILDDPRIEAAVLETARGGIVRRGLAFDACDVGVVLNISPDHLGQDGIETLSQLARVKSVVAEAASRAVVLNADDEMCLRMRSECRRGTQVWLVGMEPDNPQLLAHLERGGRAVYLEGRTITLARGWRREPLITVDRIPFTWYGRARFNVMNALATVAATVALGCRPDLVAQALTSFVSDGAQNPLRMNLYSLRGLPVIVDYAHNLASYQALLDAARSLTRGRVVGVVSMPGDRRDEDIDEVGVLCGQGLDRTFVFEMEDRRGRAPGDLAHRMAASAQRAAPHHPVDIVLDATEALARAVSCCGPNDLLVFGCASDLSEFGSLAQDLVPLRPEDLWARPRPVRGRPGVRAFPPAARPYRPVAEQLPG